MKLVNLHVPGHDVKQKARLSIYLTRNKIGLSGMRSDGRVWMCVYFVRPGRWIRSFR